MVYTNNYSKATITSRITCRKTDLNNQSVYVREFVFLGARGAYVREWVGVGLAGVGG